MLKVRTKAVIFDLDNVLFDEKDYILLAYRGISSFLAEKCRVSESRIYSKLVTTLESKGTMYNRLFNDLIVELELDQNLISEILSLYCSVQGDIKPYHSTEKILQGLLSSGKKLGLVTNGSVLAQQNKVRLLGISRYFEKIIYARELGKENEKPNPKPYELMLKELGVASEESVCIGDNPYTDFRGARQIGLKTIRLLKGEFKDVKLGGEFEADFSISELEEIEQIFGSNF